MDAFAVAGMSWWNGLDEQMRRYWFDMAKSASVADAYRAFLQYRDEMKQGYYAPR